MYRKKTMADLSLQPDRCGGGERAWSRQMFQRSSVPWETGGPRDRQMPALSPISYCGPAVPDSPQSACRPTEAGGYSRGPLQTIRNTWRSRVLIGIGYRYGANSNRVISTISDSIAARPRLDCGGRRRDAGSEMGYRAAGQMFPNFRLTTLMNTMESKFGEGTVVAGIHTLLARLLGRRT